MAGLAEDNSTNGARPRRQECTAPAAGKLDVDHLLAHQERTLAGSDQTRSDRDQTAADGDQTAADGDQAAADSDQAAADRDQAAADSDQAASDRELVEGGDPGLHRLTRHLRNHSAEQRQEGTRQRIEAAAVRDAVAHARDLVAAERDQVAERHDRELEARDVTSSRLLGGADLQHRAAEDRARAAADRAAAAEGRARAAADRRQAAHDREQAWRDRLQAEADREALLRQLAIAETDALTGTHTRGVGLTALAHELDRASRTAGQLVVVYIDVVGLKAVNDTYGHAAGDAVLRRAVDEVRRRLRSYDLVIRLGGDEFLCVMPGATIDNAQRRFNAIQIALGTGRDSCAIRLGFAAPAPGDTADMLIERADANLQAACRRE